MGGKLIVFSAPSGSGKTTIVQELARKPELNLAFSVSATSRKQRPGEIDGKHYYFVTPEAFRQKIENGEFIEWEEVYPDHFYGTLRSEVERLLKEGKNVIFDIDVKGGMNIKKAFPDRTMTLFVQVPDEKVLEQRLKSRNTEDEKSLQMRLQKVKKEWQYAPYFDRIIINDDLSKSITEAYNTIKAFVNEGKEE